MWNLAWISAFLFLIICESVTAGCTGVGHTAVRDACPLICTAKAMFVIFILGVRSYRIYGTKNGAQLGFLPLATFLISAWVVANCGGMGAE